ncbi:hypothetical protein A4A58_15115 [Tardiphaga robiniae]|uniref:Uncharacterized protein n=1 Tax=Tardiphaga robiniae TaxID=943830 RepID=A0A163XMK2_9BRAD|nr:hypothetical protein A4A58_15115 [Tardiphaga robiniae]
MLGILTSFVRQCAISLGGSLLLAATAFAVARPPHKSPPFQPAAIERRPATAAVFIGASSLALNSCSASDKMVADINLRPMADGDQDVFAELVSRGPDVIDMAQAVLCYGHEEKLRRLARQIMATRHADAGAMPYAIPGSSVPVATARFGPTGWTK